ncbi:MAG: enoyl-CoA hydratase-related protein [Rhodococcus sp. (in: high G+C Gram-positive bacteria)]|uniref:enoyl-CoA hydratase-related protein n=1 Tax=Rhodococcus sp. TaxID=1831 RepID=UPI003BAF1AAA
MTVDIRNDGPVRHILIDRPQRMNAVDAATLDRLADEITRAGEDPGVRVIVLSGTGRAFCAGGDLEVEDPLSVENTECTADAAARCITAITGVTRPVVAAVRGPAVGVGVSLAVAADLAIVRSDTFFSMPFTSIGLMPDGGSTALVAAAVGRATAMRMSLLGERVTARDAVQLGLVAVVSEPESFEAELESVVGRLISYPQGAVETTKFALNASTLSELPNALARERAGQIGLTTSDGFRDAIAAFTAGRVQR